MNPGRYAQAQGARGGFAWHCRAEDPDKVFFSDVMMRLSVRLQGRGSRAVFQKNLSAKQARNLSDQFDQTLERRNKFVRVKLALVVSVKGFKHHNLGLLDLVQDGNLGLMRAVTRFDPRMGGSVFRPTRTGGYARRSSARSSTAARRSGSPVRTCASSGA